MVGGGKRHDLKTQVVRQMVAGNWLRSLNGRRLRVATRRAEAARY